MRQIWNLIQYLSNKQYKFYIAKGREKAGMNNKASPFPASKIRSNTCIHPNSEVVCFVLLPDC